MLIEVFTTIALIISSIGSVIITWGVVLTTFGFIRMEMKRITKADVLFEREFERYRLGTYLLLGLDFLLASDIIQTILHPGFEELYILGIIVTIRFILSFLLNREMDIEIIRKRRDRKDD